MPIKNWMMMNSLRVWAAYVCGSSVSSIFYTLIACSGGVRMKDDWLAKIKQPEPSPVQSAAGSWTWSRVHTDSCGGHNVDWLVGGWHLRRFTVTWVIEAPFWLGYSDNVRVQFKALPLFVINKSNIYKPIIKWIYFTK